MQKIKKIKILNIIGVAILAIGLLNNCQGQTKKKDLEMKDTNALESFKKQKHRFEFRENLLFYNDQQVKIDQPLSYYENIFGKEYKTNSLENVYYYNNIPLTLLIDESRVETIKIRLYYIDEKEEIKEKRKQRRNEKTLEILNDNYVLIDNTPVNKNTNLSELNDELLKKGHQPFNISMGGSMISRQYINKNPIELSYHIGILRGASSFSTVYYGNSKD